MLSTASDKFIVSRSARTTDPAGHHPAGSFHR